MNLNYGILCAVVICSCGHDPQTSGTWIETTNGSIEIEIRDSSGLMSKPLLRQLSAERWTTHNMDTSVQIIDGKLHNLDSSRQVLIAGDSNFGAIYTWLPRKSTAPIAVVMSAPLTIEGIAPEDFDSVGILGLDQKSVIPKGGRYKLANVPRGVGLLMLKKANHWIAALETSFDSVGLNAKYNLLNCSDQAAYDGRFELGFLTSDGASPYSITSASKKGFAVHSNLGDSLFFWVNGSLKSRLLPLQLFAFDLDSVLTNVRVEQKGAWPICLGFGR